MNNKSCNMSQIQQWFRPKEELFKIFKSSTLNYDSEKQRRIFIDRDSDILLVAHIDTVWPAKYWGHKNPTNNTTSKGRIFGIGFDDRIGCYISYMLSKELGLDLLLCDNEESGRSTGMFHQLKEYNWIAEFDRRNDDVVTYDCDSEYFQKCLKKYWKVGWGTFSDIVFLNTNVCCVNIGTGVSMEHSKTLSVVNLRQMKSQISKFKKFYNKYKDTPFKRDFKQASYVDYNYNYYKNFNRGKTKYYETLVDCDFCERWVDEYEIEDVYMDGDWWFLCEDCRLLLSREIDDKGNKIIDTMICPDCSRKIPKSSEVCPYCYYYVEQGKYPRKDRSIIKYD